jgi:hypothetical protein
MNLKKGILIILPGEALKQRDNALQCLEVRE